MNIPCSPNFGVEMSSGTHKQRAFLERAGLTIAVAGFFVTGYFGVGLSRTAPSSVELATRLDARIPFIANSVWVYLWIFPTALIPLFLVKCQRLFRRTALSYAVAIGVSLGFFILLPITSTRLRVAETALDLSHPSHWAVSVVYQLDPPYNLFPSLHLTIAILAAFSAWKAKRLYGIAVFLGMVLVGVSVCTVKQHYLLDVLGGIALAAATAALFLSPYRPAPSVSPAYRWTGPAIYIVFLVLAYAGFYVAYLISQPRVPTS